MLRLTDGLDPARIRHIPRVLYHWRAAQGSGTFSDRALARAEAARLRAWRRSWRPGADERSLGRRLQPADPGPCRNRRRVSAIIPTRDRAEICR